MTTATVEVLKDAYEDNPTSARIIENIAGMSRGKFEATKARAWLNGQKTDHLNHRLGKGTRPWDIVNVSGKLDPKQPWFGVEYETGYNDKTAYHKVINYLWQHHPLTAIDREGCGRYPCEITFAPVNMEDFMSKSYHMDRLLAYQKKHEADHAQHRPGDNVGTHVNVSTPAFRKLSRNGANNVATLLNHIKPMSAADYKRVYGRQPYGGFNANGDQRGNMWIEGKLFNSTGSPLVWAKYKLVMSKIGELIEYFSRLEAKGKLPDSHRTPKGRKVAMADLYGFNGPQEINLLKIPNLADFLLGTVDIKDLELTYVPWKKNGVYV